MALTRPFRITTRACSARPSFSVGARSTYSQGRESDHDIGLFALPLRAHSDGQRFATDPTGARSSSKGRRSAPAATVVLGFLPLRGVPRAPVHACRSDTFGRRSSTHRSRRHARDRRRANNRTLRPQRNRHSLRSTSLCSDRTSARHSAHRGSRRTRRPATLAYDAGKAHGAHRGSREHDRGC